MGRESLYGFNAYSPLDLTRFTGPGAEDFGNYSEANFASDNGGTTNLGNFVAHFGDGERRFHAMVSRYFARS